MSMKIANNYSQFYRGTESIKQCGSAIGSGKDTLVKYEFNTTDADGKKVMDKMSREDTLRTMNEISAQYGDNVIVEFSGDGLANLVNAEKNNNLDEIMGVGNEKQASFDKAVTQMENTHRIVIPNIQTNEKLQNSLQGADESAIRATTGIIKNYFLPSDVGEMSEQERQDMIALGLEEARYLAENYLEGEKADDYLSAMETIAKYGLNGIVAENGKVTYNIPKGPMVGAPDDYVNTSDILKEKAPDLYEQIKELNQNIINRKPGEKYSTQFLELHKRAEKVLNSMSEDGEHTNREVAIQEYADWKQTIEETELPTTYQNARYEDIQSLFESLQGKGSLSSSWMEESMKRFMKWIEW